MGRPRTNFKPYKDIKRKKTGVINFYIDNNFHGAYRYECPSLRKIKITDFKRMAKRKTEIKHIYHYEIIPLIDE